VLGHVHAMMQGDLLALADPHVTAGCYWRSELLISDLSDCANTLTAIANC